MQQLAPIALFVYNRPDHTFKTLSHLRQNSLASKSMLFIFSDGPKSSKDEMKVKEVREIIKDTPGFKSVEIIEQPQNMGLANSIINGVTNLVNTYGMVIVFEDDLLSSPHTLTYFNDALNTYQNKEKVMHIGGYMYPLKNDNLPESFFYRAASSWGWATWKRAWDNFEPDIDRIISQFDHQKINDFSIDGVMNFWKQVNEFKHGINNSWAIRWYASIFLKGGLTLNPAKSFITNIGSDGSGIHSGVSEIYDVDCNNAVMIKHFPADIHEDKKAYNAIKLFLKNRKGNLWKRLKRFTMQKIAELKN